MSMGLCEYLDTVAATEQTPGAADVGAAYQAALSGLGVVRVTGEEARSFLHGQLTTDLRKTTANQATLAAWCSPKGRVLFLMQLLYVGETFLLVLPRSEIAALLKRLKLYVLRAKVGLEDLSTEWSVMGIAGPTVTKTAAADDIFGMPLQGTAALQYFIGPHAAVIEYWAQSGLPRVDETRWAAAEILAGLPAISGATSDRFLPQELNLDELKALHFDKGCYPGQEVIARLKYRGQVKARLQQGRTAAGVAAGDRLYAGSGTAVVGEVVRVAPLDGASIVLAVLNLDATDTPVRLRSPEGPLIQFPA